MVGLLPEVIQKIANAEKALAELREVLQKFIPSDDPRKDFYRPR